MAIYNELQIRPNISPDDVNDHYKKQKPPTFTLFGFELVEKMKESFEQKETETLQLIKNHLKHFKKPYVVSSHGKDSIVMVHLINRACCSLHKPMIPVWLNNTLNIYPEEREYWKSINKFLGIESVFHEFTPPLDNNGRPYTVWSIIDQVKHLPRFRATARQDGASSKYGGTPECCTILKKQSIKDALKLLPKSDRFDCVFVGTRAEESHIRKLGVLQRCRSYFVKTRTAYPIQTVTPLSFWKAIDILEYFHRYNIPKNPAYAAHNLERLGCASCPAHKNWEQRLACDPTKIGPKQLEMNFKKMSKYEPDRLQQSCLNLAKFLRSNNSNHLTANRRKLICGLIAKYSGQQDITSYGSVTQVTTNQS